MMNCNIEQRTKIETVVLDKVHDITISLDSPKGDNTLMAAMQINNQVSHSDIVFSLASDENATKISCCNYGLVPYEKMVYSKLERKMRCKGCSLHFTWDNQPVKLKCRHYLCIRCIHMQFDQEKSKNFEINCEKCIFNLQRARDESCKKMRIYKSKGTWMFDEFLAFNGLVIDYDFIQKVYLFFARQILEAENSEAQDLHCNYSYDKDNFFKEEVIITSRKSCQIYQCPSCCETYNKLNKPYVILDCHTMCKRCVSTFSIKYRKRAVLIKCPFDSKQHISYVKEPSYLQEFDAIIDKGNIPIKEDSELLSLVYNIYGVEAKQAEYKEVFMDKALLNSQNISCSSCLTQYTLDNSPYKLECNHKICRKCIFSQYKKIPFDKKVTIECPVDHKSLYFANDYVLTARSMQKNIEDNSDFELFLTLCLKKDYDLIERICLMNEASAEIVLNETGTPKEEKDTKKNRKASFDQKLYDCECPLCFGFYNNNSPAYKIRCGDHKYSLCKKCILDYMRRKTASAVSCKSEEERKIQCHVCREWQILNIQGLNTDEEILGKFEKNEKLLNMIYEDPELRIKAEEAEAYSL